MKISIDRLIILVLLSACNNTDLSKIQQAKQDTLVTDPHYTVDTPTDIATTTFESLNHTAGFLNLRFGISKPEYEKLKDSLIQVKKLTSIDREIQYRLLLPDAGSTNLFDKDIKVHKTSTVIGVLNPTFYKDSLMQLDIIFRSNEGGQLYSFLEQNLLDKYSGQKAVPKDFFSKQKTFDTLQVGKVLSWSIDNQWQFGDTFIYLEMEETRKRISPKKYENSAIIKLVYSSKFLRQRLANDLRTKENDSTKRLQNDF